MKLIVIFLVFALSAFFILGQAQTNLPAQGGTSVQTNLVAKTPAMQEVEIDSDTGYFDGITNEIVYTGHVFVTDHEKVTMTCERLTIDLPSDRGHPTNIVAETDVVVDLLDNKGQTNHITSNKAVYAYHLLNPVTNLVVNPTNLTSIPMVSYTTNETITFTGGDPTPKVVSSQTVITGDPLIMDVPSKVFKWSGKTIYRPHQDPNGATNSSPFNLLK